MLGLMAIREVHSGMKLIVTKFTTLSCWSIGSR